jgi:checkpoint serine/threonine-protein kinase
MVILKTRVEKANEMFELGIDRKARPLARLQRRHAEFQQRMQHARYTGDLDVGVVKSVDVGRGLSAPKTDLGKPLTDIAARPSNSKLQVYRDADPGAAKSNRMPNLGDGRGDYGTLSSRNKENTVQASRWTDAKLSQVDAMTAKPIEKLSVYRDPSISVSSQQQKVSLHVLSRSHFAAKSKSPRKVVE